MMGDYIDAMESLSNIEKEIVEQMDKQQEGSKPRKKLTTLLIRLLRERATLLCIQKKYTSVDEWFQASLAL